MDIALTALNYNRICHTYNIYSGINRGVNKKEGVILEYFNVYNILIFITQILLQLTIYTFFNQSEASLARFEFQDPKIQTTCTLGQLKEYTNAPNQGTN